MIKRFVHLGDPRVQLSPRGLYGVTIGEKVVINCHGYGFPVPTLTITFPRSINASSKGVEIIQERRGLLVLKFTAEEESSGMYSCNGVSSLGKRNDWITIRGSFNFA